MPAYLQGLDSIQWHQARSSEELKQLLKIFRQDARVVIRSDFLSKKTLEAFLGWTKAGLRVFFIFIAQTIENSAYQVSLGHPEVVLIRESERKNIAQILERALEGKIVRSRKQERVSVQSPVILKKSALSITSPIGAWVQMLREGQMQDFSAGGARVSLEQGSLRSRDYISLMYKNDQGQWVSVESQVRWVVSTGRGTEIIGVQFLAVSA